MKHDELIIAITGASGAIYGIRLLEVLKQLPITTHLIVSKSAGITISYETEYSIEQVKELADNVHNVNDIAACISSGSYHSKGMIIAPCSIKTMSQIATGNTDNIISRSADVILKEQRKLVLMLRETPLHLGHLRNLTLLAEMGAIVNPPVPAFYNNPKNIDDIINHSVGRVLDLFDIDHRLVNRWQGVNENN